MKQLITLIFTILHSLILCGQATEKLLNENIFKITVQEVELSSSYGIDPEEEIILRKMYGKNLPKGSAFLYQYENKKVLITSMHVIERATSMKNAIVVTDGNGKTYEVRKIGGDTFYDIAILEFVSDLPNAKGLVFSNTNIQLEQIVKPTGYLSEKNNPSIKKGIISSRQTDFKNEIGGFGYWEMSVGIEGGMSGGAVLNEKNQVIGINSRVRTVNKQPTNTSYMLDGTIAQKAIKEIIQHTRIRRAFLGIVFEQRKKTKDNIKGKVTIHSFIKNYPAPAYEILENYYDETSEIVVQKINETAIMNLNDVYKALEFIPIRSKVNITLAKNGQSKLFTIKAATLEVDCLSDITNHYFAQQKRYKLKITDKKALIEDKKKTITHRAIVAGNTDEKAFYTLSSKQEIGVIIRLCSDLGSFTFLTCENVINNKKEKELGIKSYNISNNNNDPRYTSYLLYF